MFQRFDLCYRGKSMLNTVLVNKNLITGFSLAGGYAHSQSEAGLKVSVGQNWFLTQNIL